ncbi:MAG: NAD(P)/FAD-dependent oxidoreductase [Bacteroidetes bacterium]|nr:NAD(P)/FAD-dependent oxidoreductase [Bacteroidota bacterium]
MGETYDVIIIGSGLGGLCAALECLRAGKKVLLVERHNLPGGYASSFTRGRFEFEPSLHELPNTRAESTTSGVVRYLLEDAKLRITFLAIPEAYRLILTEQHLDASLPFGVDAFIKTIEQEVPGSTFAVTKFMTLCKEVQDSFNALEKSGKKINNSQIFKKYGNFIRTGSATVEKVAKALDMPKKALDMIYPYWCYLGVPAGRMSFSIWAALLDTYISAGALIPEFRSHEISCAFLEKIYQFEGTVRFNSEVTAVNVKEKQVTGITLANGETIYSRQIICNTSPTNVFNNLVSPKEEVPKRAYAAINTRKHGLSLFVVYLGLNASKEELGLHEYSYFISPHMDTEKLYTSTYDIETDEIMQASICLNAANPDCSPKGTTILSITAGFHAEAWEHVSNDAYFKTKDRIAKKLIHQFEKATNTEIFKHIEEIEIATPETFARYTGAYNGIVYGYEPEPWDGIVPRVLSQEKENYIEGIQFCGGFSYRCHGYGSSVMSGKAAAERTCAKMDGPS